ncbi:O-antigen ligase family protein [Phocaeicola sp.]
MKTSFLVYVSAIYLFVIYYVYDNGILYNIVKYAIFPIVVVCTCLIFKNLNLIEKRFGIFFISHSIFILYIFLLNSFMINADSFAFIPILSSVYMSFILANLVSTQNQFIIFISAIFLGSFSVVIFYFFTGKQFVNESVQFVLDEGVNANGIAHMFFLGFICNSSLLILISRYYVKIILFISLFIYIFVFLIVGSRQAFVLISVFWILFIIFFYWDNHKLDMKNISKVLAWLFIICLMIYMIYFFFPNNPLFVKFAENEDDSRMELVHQALELFKLKPFWGYGFGTFKNYSHFVYTHNMHTEILFSGGIIAALIYYIPFILFIYGLLMQLSNSCNIIDKKVLSITLAFIVTYFVGGIFFIMPNSSIAYMLLFILMRYSQIANQKIEE